MLFARIYKNKFDFKEGLFLYCRRTQYGVD